MTEKRGKPVVCLSRDRQSAESGSTSKLKARHSALTNPRKRYQPEDLEEKTRGPPCGSSILSCYFIHRVFPQNINI